MKIISPIAIDMGAKNTGVYYANYKQGSSFDEIDKKGEVLIYDKYTPLLKDRTANRHARRGYQRKKLAKRLLSLVLENYFEFPAKQHTQAIGFLLNRRGFTFLEEDYSKDALNSLPEEVWQDLSVEVRELLDERPGIANKLVDLATNQPEQITDILNAIQEIDDYQTYQTKKEAINKEFVYFDYIEKINKACDLANQGRKVTDKEVELKKRDKKNLSKTSNWIVERLNHEIGSNFVVPEEEYQTDLTSQINSIKAKQIQRKLPDFKEKRAEVKSRETENNKSPWHFNISKFEFNPTNEKGLEENKKKNHLHHFCYAIYKINNEIISGARHRLKYFKEIEEDLSNFESHTHQYLKKFAQAIKANKKLDNKKLHKLICHISNFELKPLRAYFNDSSPIQRKKEYRKTDQTKSNFVSHKNGGDKFNNKKLSRLASTWFMKNWRVDSDRDKKDKVDDHNRLKEQWQGHNDKNDIIAFWLKTDPVLTIPPYQNMNNRKPPKCQTLVLNGEYLDKHYPNWKDWIASLNPDKGYKGYKEKMQSLQNGKGKRERKGKPIDGRLVSDELISLRQLQFVLDAAKKIDKYKLNDIWSAHHKIQQLEKDNTKDSAEIKIWKGKLKKSKEESQLLNKLKQDLDFDKHDSFGHFINKYYKNRRKAKDGRYFLIQEKKEKWLTDGRLLILCQHKPKQKKYQWLLDLSAILGVDSNKIGGKEPEDWLKEIPEFKSEFKSACTASAKAQKDHRGGLKTQIDQEFRKEKGNLYKLNDKCEKLAIKLSALVFDDLSKDDQSKKAKKFKSIFSFAQIDNIVFKDRNGFSKTCPVCSTDNAFRMNEVGGFAQAQRLPGLSIRLIDGVVMRICDAISRKVAVTRWHDIEADLEKGSKVIIPLIFEQNRFEFEPGLAKIKERKPKNLNDDRENQHSDKKARIKKSAQGISAYSGKPLSKGEIDHIIPRSSKHGTLNDEANLIYLSNKDNQYKSNEWKILSDLHIRYKNKIFNDKIDREITDEKIKQFTYDHLEGEGATVSEAEEDTNFAFGGYLSFINLTSGQQIAFRHALFLSNDDPLKQKVIKAIKNRNRSIVNGTQRYLAQCIADKLYKIAKQHNKEKQIEFDYFEYSSRADIPNSTYNLRKLYGIEKPERQPLYSHLIDAQMAFLLAADDHKNDGTMGLKFDEKQTIWEAGVDEETGEVLPGKLFDMSKVGKNNFSEVNLCRKKSTTGVRLSRSFHRPNFYAENYAPLFFGKKDNKDKESNEIEIKAGFDWKNSVKVPNIKKNTTHILNLLQFAKNSHIANNKYNTIKDLYNDFNKKTQYGDFEVFYMDWDKTKIQKYLVSEFSNKDIADGKKKKWSDEITFLRKLSYVTRKQEIKEAGVIEDVLKDNKIGGTKVKKYFGVKLFGKEIVLPSRNEWENLSKEWDMSSDKEFSDFIKKYFCGGQRKNQHKKARKVFSLTVIDRQGHFLQKRQSWSGQDVYQISADSDSRKDGNKFSRLVRMENGELKEVINKPFQSKNTFKLKFPNVETGNNYHNIDPNKWIEINKNNDFPSGVEKIEYCVDNTTRPQVRVHVSNDLEKDDIDRILKNELTKAKDKKDTKKLKENLENIDTPNSIEYTASGFNEKIKKNLLEVLSKDSDD